MEFWGVEVKSGVPLKCTPDSDKLVHLSQIALGEFKKEKGNESATIFVKIGDKKLLLATLSPDKSPHLSLDLIFEKEFELSHSWKGGSIYFCGYQLEYPERSDDFEDSDSDSDSEEELPIKKTETENKDVLPKSSMVKPAKMDASAKSNAQVDNLGKIIKPKEDEDEDDDTDLDSDEEDESDEDEDMLDGNDSEEEDSDEDESSEEEEEDATPVKSEKGKKRPAETASKTPEKKAKLMTPSGAEKTGDSKKSGHAATPHPTKQGAKTPANADKKPQTPANADKKPQTPKSGAQVPCKSCSKSFNSENALQSHSKAKHSSGK